MDQRCVLQHVHQFENGSQDVKLIGVYSSRRQTEAAIRRLVTQPRFPELLDSLSIHVYELYRDHGSGFVMIE